MAWERNRRAELRGICCTNLMAGVLRRELGEAHRLIDGLCRRFLDTVMSER